MRRICPLQRYLWKPKGTRVARSEVRRSRSHGRQHLAGRYVPEGRRQQVCRKAPPKGLGSA